LSSRPEKYDRLVGILADVVNLRHAAALLYWDQQTMMPTAAAQARGHHMATVDKLAHAKLTSPEVGQLLDDLKDHEATLPYDSDEAATLRVARRQYEKATRIPPDLIVRISLAGAEGYVTWRQAREANDYKVFQPALERTYALMREVTEALGWEDHPLDALVDEFEPGLKTAQIEALFDDLRATLVPLGQAIFNRPGTIDDGPVRRHFPSEAQLAASQEAAVAVGFDLDTRGRLDLSVHPFTTSFSPCDVRITTKVDESFLPTSLFATLHEAGHGLYEQGLPVAFQESILGEGASSGIHESQSLLWENVVGRSRGFCEFFLPRLRSLFPDQLGGMSPEGFYRAVNKVQPSLIRVDADEVTYNLHVMIRFELEKAVFDGRLSLGDLAEAWRAKFKDYLGIVPPDDLSGVLQDIHWTGGFGACFVSYTVGHVSGLQLYEKARAEIPDLERGFARGDFAALREWMNRNVHAHGRKYTPQELVERATGRRLETGPYLTYIKGKFKDIYGL
jgi:carboxypeptidase Taq